MNGNPLGEYSNRIYSYIKIFCLQNHNAVYIITEKGYPHPWLSAIHTLVFARAKLGLLFS